MSVVGKDKIEVSEYGKILGVIFDNRRTLHKHITNICRSVNIHIRKINSIRRYLSDTAVRTLVQSIVIARLDYELHWLPINKRCQFINKWCQFKILILTVKSLNGCAPEYLCDMLNVYMPNRSLRSTAFTSLVSYRNRSIRLGKRLFGTSAAKLWNELPRNKLLKTFIFFSIRSMCI